MRGLNYYRLKQVDKDGKFQYSVITRVYFGEAAGSTLRVFPQPAKTSLNIVFEGRGRDVLIQAYDAAGKMVLNERKPNAGPLTITTSQLADGIYWIVVSDGNYSESSVCETAIKDSNVKNQRLVTA